MTMRYVAIGVASFLGAAAFGGAPAQALTMKECSAKYKAAQTANTLNGQKWKDFRKAECGTDAAATPAATPAAAPAAAPAPAAAAKPAPAPKAAAAPKAAPAAPAAASNATFPSAVSDKYAK